MEYNNELQIIDNQNKAYLLGLFYADGNISKNQHHSKLYIKDKELIDRLKIEFPFFNYYSRENYLFGIQSGKKDVRQHFISNGCLPDKSISNKENLKLPFKNEFTSHFIRGYFDGDGCIYVYDNYGLRGRVFIYGTYDFLLEVQKRIPCESKIKKYSNSSIYELSVSKKAEVNKFFNFIYNNSSIYLKRKKEKFLSLTRVEL